MVYQGINKTYRRNEIGLILMSELIINNSKVVLKTDAGQTKNIGEIIDRNLIVFRDPQKHLMRKWNSYGFNGQIIDSGMVDTIIIQEKDGGNFMVTIDQVKALGRYHREPGEEPQYFVPREILVKI